MLLKSIFALFTVFFQGFSIFYASYFIGNVISKAARSQKPDVAKDLPYFLLIYFTAALTTVLLFIFSANVLSVFASALSIEAVVVCFLYLREDLGWIHDYLDIKGGIILF